MDHLRKKGRKAKSALFAELILPAYIYSDRALCLDTEFHSKYSYLRRQTARQKGKTDYRAVSAAELNEFPKILNPLTKVLMETSLPKTFRETNV